MAEPPPPPPPHGQNPRPPGGLPDGNYDIFIVPPHSAGSGFLYLPSLQTHRNSFIAGIAVALVSVGLYTIVTPVLKTWMSTVMAGNAWGVLILVVIVGVGAWAFGKTSGESASTGAQPNNPGPDAGSGQRQGYWEPPPQSQPPPKPEPKPESAQSGWEKAREETRKREEARKRTEEFEKRRADAAKAKEEAERTAKAKAEKDKWEQARAREREQREREARDKARTGSPDKEAREKSIRERMDKLRKEREEREKQKAASNPGRPSPRKEYVRPTAKSAVGTEDQYSYRPYDTPKPPRQAYHASSASSISGLSESSYAASQTTAQTTPPPSHRGPYSTKDPDKILIRAVYLFNDSFPTKPVAQLIVGQGSVTDGLILNIRTEGLFIDDDVRQVPQREWDVKAWTLKLVEDGSLKSGAVGGQGLHVLRATVRNAENSKYCFVLDETEGWKVAIGLQRLRKGSQVRSLGMSGMKENEVRGLLGALGWV